MAKKEVEKTKHKLSKLESVFGEISDKKEKKVPKKEIKNTKKRPKSKKKSSFRTSEVVIILIITLVTSLAMGGFVAYKLLLSNTEKLDSELKEFIDNYEYITENYNGELNKKEIMDAALEGMLSKLDKNSIYLDSKYSKNFNTMLEGSYDGLGIQIYKEDDNIIIYSVYDGSPAAKAGLKAGDVLKKINGKDLKGMETEDVVKLVKDNSKKTMSLVYERNGKKKTIKISVGTVELQSVGSTIYVKNDKKIGYIGISIFASNSYKQFKSELQKLEKENIDGLIIDLRNNSGGYLSASENIISLFLDSKHVIYQIQKDDLVTKHYSKGSKTKKYKIAVLVDGSSASASEILASALQEQYGATLVGTKTYGKGTVQELQNLSDGDKYKFTTKNWLTSKGVWVDGKGITPDKEVSLDEKYAEDPTEENDNQLQEAIACLE